jgi:Helix-turn-helix domain
VTFGQFYPRMYTGVVAGLIDGRHHKRLGAAWMLFQWCIMRQTGQGINPTTGKEEGVVCRGHAVSYSDIAREMNCSRGSVRDWMRRLVAQKYIRTERDRRGIYIYVLNPKKFRVSKVQHSQRVQSVEGSTL